MARRSMMEAAILATAAELDIAGEQRLERVEACFENCWAVVYVTFPALDTVIEAAPELGADAESEWAPAAVTADVPAGYLRLVAVSTHIAA